MNDSQGIPHITDNLDGNSDVLLSKQDVAKRTIPSFVSEKSLNLNDLKRQLRATCKLPVCGFISAIHWKNCNVDRPPHAKKIRKTSMDEVLREKRNGNPA